VNDLVTFAVPRPKYVSIGEFGLVRWRNIDGFAQERLQQAARYGDWQVSFLRSRLSDPAIWDIALADGAIESTHSEVAKVLASVLFSIQ